MAFVSEVSLIKFQPALTYTACSHGTVFYIKQSHIVPATATEVQYGQNCYIIGPSAGPTYIYRPEKLISGPGRQQRLGAYLQPTSVLYLTDSCLMSMQHMYECTYSTNIWAVQCSLTSPLMHCKVKVQYTVL